METNNDIAARVPEPRPTFQSSLVKKELSLEEKQEQEKLYQESLINLQKEFDEQLQAFALDESYFDDYKKYTPLKAEILIKLFKFIPTNKTGLGVGLFMVQSPVTKEWKPRHQTLSEKIYPICKVIKIGEGLNNNRIVPGGLYIVPFNDVMGTAWNPDFLHLMQNFAKNTESGKIANVPADMPQRLPNLDINWDRYKFSMPDRVTDETEDDKLVYLIPEVKLNASYEPDF